MRLLPTAIADVRLLEPRVFGDERGFFFESYNQRTLAEVQHKKLVRAGYVKDGTPSNLSVPRTMKTAPAYSPAWARKVP